MRRNGLVSLGLLLGTGACTAVSSLPDSTLSDGNTWTRVGVRPVLQRSQYDCAVAAAATFWSAHRNGDVTYEEAETRIGKPVASNRSQGVPLSAIKSATVSATRKAFVLRGDRPTLVHELRKGRPVILGVRVRGGTAGVLSHFVVLVGCEEDCLGTISTVPHRWLIWDPGAGISSRPGYALVDDQTLEPIWRPAGFPILVSLLESSI